MWNKLSYKYGFLFFIVLLFLQIILFGSLTFSIVNHRVNDAVHELLARGSTYSQLVATFSSKEDMQRIMEIEELYASKVIVTDQTKLQILAKSGEVTQDMLNRIRESKEIITKRDTVVEGNWRGEGDLCTVSPLFINHQLKGYVYMFQETSFVKGEVLDIVEIFGTVFVVFLGITFVVGYYLTKKLTEPIIRMKEMTMSLLNQNRIYLSKPKPDVDEIGELEHFIQELVIGLREIESNRHEFLASISHELRTPLTYLSGYIQILSKRELSEDQRIKYITIIKEETISLGNLIENLFLLARMDENEFEVTQSKVEIASFCSRCLEKARLMSNENNTILLQRQEQCQFIKMDDTRMEQVLLNLIQNAIRYGEKGGVITISTKVSKSSFQFLVHNYGSFISNEQINKIFQPFYREEKSRSRETGGYGLGLSVVSQIIQKHQGEIQVESTKEKGTTFIISIPKAEVN